MVPLHAVSVDNFCTLYKVGIMLRSGNTLLNLMQKEEFHSAHTRACAHAHSHAHTHGCLKVDCVAKFKSESVKQMIKRVWKEL